MRGIIEEVAADNLGRAVDFASPREAYSQRSRFYAFIAAVKRDLTASPAWMDKAAREDLTSFLQRAMAVEFLVQASTLIVRPRDESPLADKLRGARVLDAPTPAAAADPAEASLAALLEKTNAR